MGCLGTLIPALIFYAIGLLIAWLIWGRGTSDDNA
jgi:hypothetical protein